MAVLITTNQGTFTIELNHEKAPQTVDNFLSYVTEGFYNGTIFHRIIAGFMIQGGGFEAGMKQKDTKEPIQNEAKNGLKNEMYTIAMARTSDPHSASAQFFINTENNPTLDDPGQKGWGYCVFGKVTAGIDIVDKIAAVQTSRRGMFDDVPVTDVVIEKAEIID